MRLRITRQPTGSVDGIRLDDFIVGFVYDIGTTLGSYLLAEGVAEPADDDVTAHVAPLSEVRFSVIAPTSSEAAPAPDGEARPEIFVVEPLSQAADRPRPAPRQTGSTEPSAT